MRIALLNTGGTDHTVVRFAGASHALRDERPAVPAALKAAIGDRVREHRARWPGDVIEAHIRTPKLAAGRIAHGQVVAVIDALRELGASKLLLDGSPFP